MRRIERKQSNSIMRASEALTTTANYMESYWENNWQSKERDHSILSFPFLFSFHPPLPALQYSLPLSLPPSLFLSLPPSLSPSHSLSPEPTHLQRKYSWAKNGERAREREWKPYQCIYVFYPIFNRHKTGILITISISPSISMHAHCSDFLLHGRKWLVPSPRPQTMPA